jgi:hypothetical protein
VAERYFAWGQLPMLMGCIRSNNVPMKPPCSFRFVGMKPRHKSCRKINFNVVLEETIGIEEVVAIVYGTMKKSDIKVQCIN